MTESKDYEEMKNTPYESYYLKEEGAFLKSYIQTVLTILAAPFSCFCCVYSVFICNARVSEANIYDIIRSTDMDEAMKTFKDKAENMQKNQGGGQQHEGGDPEQDMEFDDRYQKI